MACCGVSDKAPFCTNGPFVGIEHEAEECVENARFGGLRELRVGSEYRLFDGWILLREQAGCEEQVK